MIRAYHFVGDKLRDGRPVPPDDDWLIHNEPIMMCESGLHASRHPFDALMYAPGPVLCLVDCDEIDAEENDKLVCRRRRIVARFDATALMRTFARQCALDVIHLWDAPQVVREYLTTGDESLKASTEIAASAREIAASVREICAAYAQRDAPLRAGAAAGAAGFAAAAGLAATEAVRGAAWNSRRAIALNAVYSHSTIARRKEENAAWNSERGAQRERFARLVADEFARMGVTA